MEINRGSILVFVDYFKELPDEQPDWGHWARRLSLANKWLNLFDKYSITQDEIDTLMKELRCEVHPGSGWLDITIQFWYWSNDKGYNVPGQINPWAK